MPTNFAQADSITIRRLYTLEECALFQEVQRRVWGGEAEIDIVPVHVLVTQAKNGGLLLGAFAENGPEATGGMVGLTFGWPALAEVNGGKILKFCSHMAGVLPTWQGCGIGLRLKVAQREILLADGLMDYMTWTYDPLQRVNAVFNIHRLGATCVTYMRNVYGEMQDHLNAGMPSDRFQVDWRLRSRRVEAALSPQRQRFEWQTLPLEVLSTRPVTFGSSICAPISTFLSLDGRPLAVPLPESVAALRNIPGLLMEWRLFLREAMEQGFGAGYKVVDCVQLPEGGWHYLLVPQQNTIGGDWLDEGQDYRGIK
jgi:predicted GNAT superfamily acetyltransferase